LSSDRLDEEPIGITTGGLNGKDSYAINLTKDNVIIPIELDGSVEQSLGTITSSIQLIKGNTILTKDDGVYYTIDYSGNAINCDGEGLITISPSLFSTSTNIPSTIICTAQHGDIILTKTLNLSTNKNVFELNPSKHYLRRDLNTGYLDTEDNKITLTIRK
jgi:hypothetical protein